MDGPSPTKPALWLGFVQKLALCSRKLRRALGELTAVRGVTDTDTLILWSCQRAGAAGQPQHELVELIGVSAAQLSGLLESLGERGLLVGRRPPHDRRRQYWRTTPSGDALLTEVAQDLSNWSDHLAHTLSVEQRTTLHERLNELLAATELLTPQRKEAA